MESDSTTIQALEPADIDIDLVRRLANARYAHLQEPYNFDWIMNEAMGLKYEQVKDTVLELRRGLGKRRVSRMLTLRDYSLIREICGLEEES